MAVNIHITIIELNALHTKRQNLFQELDAVIHLLMEAKHWGLRKSRNARSEERFSRERVLSIFIPKLRLILILNSFLGSSDSLVFSELFHSLAPRPLAARSISDFLLTYLAT